MSADVLRLRRDATLEPGERPVLVEGHVRAGLGPAGPGIQAALALLAADGATEDALDDAVGENELMGLQLLLRRLEAGGWLERTVLDGDRPLATLTPFGHAFAPVLAPPRRVVLSRFALVRLDEGELVVETPRAAVRVTLHDADAAARVFALREPAELDPVAGLLARAGMAVAPGSEDERELAQWSFADLLFHARSRVGRNLGGYGGSFRLEGRFEPLPARRPAFEPAVDLPTPDLESLDEPRFQDVLDGRSSIRSHDDERPLTVEQLGEFLHRVARVRGVWHDGHEEVVSRPFPAGGSLHELELYPLVHNCAGLEPGLYHYDGHAHALGLVAPVGPPTKLLLEYARRTGVMEEPPQVAILLAARFGRMMWKYESMAYAAILKHVGVAYQTMYLVATAMGLAPCALGGGNADAFAAAAGTSYYDESTVGEFLLGTRPATTSPASST